MNFQNELRQKKNICQISTDPEISEFFEIVNQLQNEIAETLKEADLKKFGRQETIPIIRNVIGKYYALQTSPFRNAITKYILTESQRYFSIRLNEDNMDQVWNGEALLGFGFC